MAIPRFKKFQIWSACSSCLTCMDDIYKPLQTIVCRNPVWNIVPWQVVAFHEVGRCYIWTSQPLESFLSSNWAPEWWQRSHRQGPAFILCGEPHQPGGKWSKYAGPALQLMHRLKFSRQLPAQPLPHIPGPSQVRMCGGKNIKPNWCWKKIASRCSRGCFYRHLVRSEY